MPSRLRLIMPVLSALLVAVAAAVAPPRPGHSADELSVKITAPKPEGDAPLVKKDARYLLAVEGASQGVHGQERMILLYVNPHKGPAGWYLQIPPANGVSDVAEDGKWKGTCQLGNEQWPPHEEDPTFDIAVVVMAKTDAQAAVAKAKEAPDKPLTDLPQGLAQHKAERLKTKLPG